MVYDTFTFFREMDLLDIRLHELYDVVDCFVLLEADRTQSNIPKPFYYYENKERFKDFWPKIHYVQHMETARLDNPNYEVAIDLATRDMLFDGLDLNDDDIVIINDSDQVIRASAIADEDFSKSVRFNFRCYQYYLNFYEYIEWEHWWGAIGMKYKMFKDSGHGIGEIRSNIHLFDSKYKEDAGWHWHFMMPLESIRYKLIASAHWRSITSPLQMSKEFIEGNLKSGFDILGRSPRLKYVPLDDSFPKYVVDNQDKFEHIILREPL